MIYISCTDENSRYYHWYHNIHSPLIKDLIPAATNSGEEQKQNPKVSDFIDLNIWKM